MDKDKEISTVERRSIILEQLKLNKHISMSELSKLFNVSEVTLRKDLKHLENKNLLIRSRGGAMMPVKVGDDLPVEKRKILNLTLKKSIASAAVFLINDGDTIILDSGTTLMELSRLLKDFKDLTVIANALDIALQLSKHEHIKIIVPGGIFRRKSFSLIGVSAAENFRMLRADKYFVSADGITEQGLFTANLEEGQIAKIIMSNSRENIVLIDSSKFGREGLMNFATISKIHTLVTDQKMPPAYKDMLAKKGIKVVVAASRDILG